MRRAVAVAAVRAEPARLAGGEVVGDELAGGGDDDDVVDHQRRAREAPGRNLAPVSDATSRDQTTAPLPASSALRMPVPPNV